MNDSPPGPTPSKVAMHSGLQGIAKRLVEHGVLTDTQATVAESTATELDMSLLQHVVDSGLVESGAAALAAAWEYGLPVVDLDAIRINALPPANDYPVKILERLGILPLARHGHRLTVAVPYPATLTQLDELQFATGLSIDGVLAPADQLKNTLTQYLAQNERSMLDELENVDDAVSALNIVQLDEDEATLDKAATDSDDAPVVKFVNKILLDAINRGASDIQFLSPMKPSTGCVFVLTASCR